VGGARVFGLVGSNLEDMVQEKIVRSEFLGFCVGRDYDMPG